jgi:hypothetical protein
MANKMNLLLVACFGMLLFFQCGCSQKLKLGKDPVNKIVLAMTLEEKAYFVTGTGMTLPGEAAAKEDRTPGAPVVGQTQTRDLRHGFGGRPGRAAD